jgi:hypothetical protein
MTNYTLGFLGWGVELPLWSLPFLIFLIVWTYFWKGPALWYAARRGHFWWFVSILVLNTAGILELFYLLTVLDIKWKHIFNFNKK